MVNKKKVSLISWHWLEQLAGKSCLQNHSPVILSLFCSIFLEALATKQIISLF